MSRIPKWLMLKEQLSFDDVTKLVDSTPSSIENVLSQDCSEDFGLIFRFICTFSPSSCQKEFKEYRFETVARQSIRAHLKDHINDMKANGSEEVKKAFTTRNQLFKSTKNGTNKHKLSVGSEILSGKKVRSCIKSKPETGQHASVKEPKKPRVQRFTKLKKLQKEQVLPPVPPVEERAQQQKDEETGHLKDEEAELISEVKCESMAASCCDSSPEDDGSTTDSKMEAYCSDDAEGGHKISCETQTEQAGKEQETLQYKIATKLFAVDRSFWNNIEQILDDIVDAEKSAELLTQADKDMILKGMRQWMDSVQIYDKHAMSRLQDPLTQAEKSTLNGLTIEDWKKLEKGQDNESRLRLTVYANMLLREYESYPRKLKPKYCQHCEKLYTASTSLYSHLVSLAGIRHWVCSKCKDANKLEATFTRKHSLQYHILKEVGIPRYRCQQPGCNRTHNHTHHQKSHARQHTGEKHYVCTVDGCKDRFSNRNTYSRHLLQFHHVELTRSNQLHAIDEREATSKVNAARLKARERSKYKRQQVSTTTPITTSSSSSNNNNNNNKVSRPHEQAASVAAPKKRTIDENILTAAQHFLSEVAQEEEKLSDTEESSRMSFDKSMRHSASQLLSGIARDVGSTASLMLESKSPDNMGGLNLLATVSRYMNAETTSSKTEKADIAEHCTMAEKINGWQLAGDHELANTDMNINGVKKDIIEQASVLENIDIRQPVSKVKVVAGTGVKLVSLASTPETTNILQRAKLMQVIQPPFNHSTKTVHHIELAQNFIPQPIKLSSSKISASASSFSSIEHILSHYSDCNSPQESRPEIKTEAGNENINASLIIETTRTGTQISSQVASGFVNNPLALVSHNLAVLEDSKNLHIGKVIDDPHQIKQTQGLNAAHSLTMSSNNTLAKSSVNPTVSNGLDLQNVKNNSADVNPNSNSHDDLLESASFHGAPHASLALAKTPLITLTSKPASKCADPTLPGRLVTEAVPRNHLTSSNKINLSLASSLPNQAASKNIQVIKVTNTAAAAQLQLRSVSCMSGKTYLVLTSSAAAAAAQPTVSSDSESSTSTRILPFSEL